jgi:hypothetical protein
LEEMQDRVTIDGPLGVGRRAIVILDSDGERGDDTHRFGGQHSAPGILGCQFDLLVAPLAGDDLVGLDADPLPDDLHRGLLHRVGVGLDASADDDLALPERGLDDDGAAVARHGVGGEGDTGGRDGRHHGLDHDGDGGFGGNPVGRSIDEDAFREQRRPRLDDGGDELVVTSDVREAAVHTRERRVGGVFGCGR